MGKILIVDDDQASCRTLQLHLHSEGYEVDFVHSVDAGISAVADAQPDLLILDIRMPGQSGLEGLPQFKQLKPDMPVIMITAFHDMDSTIEAMQGGANDYIHKPIDLDELDAAIVKLMGRNDSGEEALYACDPAQSVAPLTMVGSSRPMKEVFKTIGMVAKSPATVLISGDSGTGKELVARAIHRSSLTPDGPFVVVNCAALVETLLESDMFGHEKGAFTGAIGAQAGKFALASGGTIFLDEISEMSPAIQAKLLRVLQYKEFFPIGSEKAQTTDARIIAATNLNLADMVAEGKFREDLYYRLQVVNIHLPPLRERKEDLMELVQVLLGRINGEMKRNVTHISKDVLNCFESYDWPGNVRELENVLTKAVALSSGDNLDRDLLPAAVVDNCAPAGKGESASSPLMNSDPTMSLDEVEKHHVQRVLDSVGWHRGQACDVLGVSRPRLRRMIQHYDLKAPDGAEVDEE